MCALWFFAFLTFHLLSCCSFILFFLRFLCTFWCWIKHVMYLFLPSRSEMQILCWIHTLSVVILFSCSKCNVIIIWPLAYFSFVSFQRWWFCSPPMTNSHSNFVYFFHFFLNILLSCSVLLMAYSLAHKWFIF